LNGLLSNFNVSPDRVRHHFEHLIFNQILSSACAKDLDIQISIFRTPDGAEVDFIVEIEGNLFAIVVKHSSNIGHSDLRGLSNFTKSSLQECIPMIFYTGDIERKIENISVLPWQKGMQEIGL
jgi:predicted AAA+ superfamily ATPase